MAPPAPPSHRGRPRRPLLQAGEGLSVRSHGPALQL